MRILEQRVDVEAARLKLEQLNFMSARNLPVDEQDIYQAVELTQPVGKQDKKTDVELAATINELTLGIERATRAGDLPLVNLLRKRIAEMLNESLPDLTELPRATGPFGKPRMDDNGDDGKSSENDHANAET